MEPEGGEYLSLPDSHKPAPPPAPGPVVVHPSNWKALEIFEACSTQWRVTVGLAGLFWIGLDYSAVERVMPRMGVRRNSNQDKVFHQLRLLEAGALRELNAREDVSNNAAHSG